MKNSFLKTILTGFIAVFFLACGKKDNDTPSNGGRNLREIKYEITGTYSGQLDVVYSDSFGATISEVITALPWSKTITYPASVQAIGITANSVVANAGVAGQTGSMKIYAGGVQKRVSDKIVGQNGLLIFDPRTYDFK